MILTVKPRSVAAASALALLLSGCGGPFDASLSGQVKLDGAPLASGSVTLQPHSADGAIAHGRIVDGGYRVQTGREFGLSPGGYAVTVVARETPAELYSEAGGPPPAGKLITPPWYRSTETSGLSVDVEPGGNTYDIELTTTPPPGWQEPKPGGRR